MTTPIKERLDGLFHGLTWSGGQGEVLWSIISALRGPDDNNTILKNRTTWRIRQAIAPDFFDILGYELPDKPLKNESSYEFLDRVRAEFLKEFPCAQEHFLVHYVYACWAYWKDYRKGEE